jgi:hypothetical protein
MHFLNQPYPYYYEGQKLWQICIVLFLLAFGFNYFIQPFNINFSEHRFSFFWICLIHTALPLAFLLMAALVLRQFRRTIDHWTVLRELLLIVGVLLLTGIGNFLVRDVIYTNPDNWSYAYLQEEITNALLVGGLLATLIVSVNLNIQFLKNQALAQALAQKLNPTHKPEPATLPKPEPTPQPLLIETEVQAETFELTPAELAYAQADGNYINLHLASGEKLMKRLSLKRLESLLKPYAQIMRTHRSYLLNLTYVDRVSGNAQGYTVILKNSPDTIPVSRNFIPEFNRRMTNS